MAERTNSQRWAFTALTVVALVAVGWLGMMVLFVLTYGDPVGEPATPRVAGFREIDGDLQVWLGPGCQLTEVLAIFRSDPLETDKTGSEQTDDLILRAPDPGVPTEYLNLAQPDPAFAVFRGLPPDFSWQEANRVGVNVRPGNHAMVDIADIIAGSPTHPEDAYYFGEFGWMTPDDVQRGNGTDWLTLCMPEPD